MIDDLFRMGLVGCLLAGCVTHDGKLTRAEARHVARKFSPRKTKTEDLTARGNEVAKLDGAADLGRHLFFYDGFTVQRSLGDGDRTQPTSCASCHRPEQNFSDARPTSVGATGKVLARRSPSLYQAFNRHFLFWDGRIDSLWAQALMPMEDIDEVGSNRLRVVREVASVPLLKQKYEAVFGRLPDLADVEVEDAWPCKAAPPRNVPTQEEQQEQFEGTQQQQLDPSQSGAEAIEFEDTLENVQETWCTNWRAIPDAKQKEITRAFVNVGKAIAAYETKIRSQGSRFDRMLASARNGTPGSPYTSREIDGLELFMTKAKCVRCHKGPDLTDDRFHYLGIVDTRHTEARPGQFLQTSRSNWLEGAFIVYEHEFSCRHAEAFGRACARKARKRLTGGRSVKTLIDAGQRVVAGQVRTPSLRNVAKNEFWMHNGEQTDELGFAVGFYNTRPRGPQPVTVLRPELRAAGKRIKPFGANGKQPLQKKVDRRARGIRLRGGEIANVVAFLKTLDGAEIDAVWREDPWGEGRAKRGKKSGSGSGSASESASASASESEPVATEPETLSTEPEE